MASVSITVGSVQIDVEDEDAGYKPILRRAREALYEVVETVGIRFVSGEEDEERG